LLFLAHAPFEKVDKEFNAIITASKIIVLQ